MTTYIDRNKFKTAYGRKLYDMLKPIAPHEDWLYLMLMLAKGDEKRKILLDFLSKGNKSVKEISDFVIEQWG